MPEKTLETLFHDGLRDLYYAERKILANLRKLSRSAQSDQLKEALENHRDQTESQIERLQQIFEHVGKPARGKSCPSIDGILEEAETILEEYKGSPALDAGLIAAAQAVEHYEICRYGTLQRWAEMLGMSEAAELLAETEQEEIDTDELLTQIADTAANVQAAEAGAEGEDIDEPRPDESDDGASDESGAGKRQRGRSKARQRDEDESAEAEAG